MEDGDWLAVSRYGRGSDGRMFPRATIVSDGDGDISMRGDPGPFVI